MHICVDNFFQCRLRACLFFRELVEGKLEYILISGRNMDIYVCKLSILEEIVIDE